MWLLFSHFILSIRLISLLRWQFVHLNRNDYDATEIRQKKSRNNNTAIVVLETNPMRFEIVTKMIALGVIHLKSHRHCRWHRFTLPKPCSCWLWFWPDHSLFAVLCGRQFSCSLPKLIGKPKHIEEL